jgi:multidrug efflux pump subunit AcrA (membrane-fusion protein)
VAEEGAETLALLREIRDAQRDLLSEYRRVANESLAMQREAFEAQRQALANQRQSIDTQIRYGRVYRASILVLLPIVGVVLWLIVKLARTL